MSVLSMVFSKGSFTEEVTKHEDVTAATVMSNQQTPNDLVVEVVNLLFSFF